MRGEDLIDEGQSLLLPSLELTAEPPDQTTGPVLQRLPLAKARAAHELLAKGGVTGKLVLVPA